MIDGNIHAINIVFDKNIHIPNELFFSGNITPKITFVIPLENNHPSIFVSQPPSLSP